MEVTEKNNLSLYILKQLENGRKKYPKETNYKKDFIKECVDNFIFDNLNFVKEYINLLIYLKGLKYFNQNISHYTYCGICENSELSEYIFDYIFCIEMGGGCDKEGFYIFETISWDKDEIIDLVKDVESTILLTIFMYFNKGLKLTEDEIKSNLIFGKNVF